MKNFIKLDRIIYNSILPFQDKQLLLSFFKKVNDQELAAVIDLTKKHPQWLEKLAKNIKQKTSVDDSDHQHWDNILEQEKQELETILSS